jgi:hypothetical protein
VKPSFIPIDDTSQEVITFIFIVFQNILTHTSICTCALLRFLGTYLAQTLWRSGLLWMISWFVDVLLLHQKPPFCYSESWYWLVQQWAQAVIPVVLHQLPMCYHFLTYQSIHTNFASVKHCSHVILKVFNGFMPLVHTQQTKTGLLNTAFFGAYGKWNGHTNTTTITQKLIIQGWNPNMVTKCVYTYSCTCISSVPKEIEM